LQLVECAHFDLTHAFAADAILRRKLLERRRLVLQPALSQNVPLPLVEVLHRFDQQIVAVIFFLGVRQDGLLARTVVH
jgi:hypothetical protein